MGYWKAGMIAALLAWTAALPCTARAASAPVPTTTTLAMQSGANALASGATVASGTVVTFVASVTSGNARLTVGQVRLCDASAPFCTDVHQFGLAQLTKAGTARFRFIPGIGRHSYKAVFASTPAAPVAYAGSSSAPSQVTVTGTHASLTAIAQTGLTGNYTLDATVRGVANVPGQVQPGGTVSFLDTSNGNAVLGTAPVSSAETGFSFPERRSPMLISGDRVTAVADFNGDGLPDLLVIGADGLKVLLGNTDGSFAPKSSNTITGQYLVSFVVGDYNGDGIPDIAVADFLGYTVHIYLGEGDGTFSIGSTLPVTVQNMVTGDFNGDGIADLASAEGYAVSIFLGNGDGTFTAAPKHSWPEINPLRLATGDFNGDGLTDLLVSDSAVYGSVFLLLSHGDGTFTKTGLTPATSSEIINMEVADLNGDGFLDLVTAPDSGNELTILLGKGDGTFKDPVPYSVPPPGDVSVADFNGDGIPDLLVGGDPSSLHLGKGDGTFEKASEFVETPSDAQIADFNGDGIPDLAGSWGTDCVLLLAQPGPSVTGTLSGVAISGTGTHQVIASYSGDSLYKPSVSPATGLTAILSPTVTVTPSQASITAQQELPVTIVVSGVKGYPTPTGLVTLTSGNYMYGSVPLVNGSLTFSIRPGSLAVGTDTLSVLYQQDSASSAFYSEMYGSASVVVAPGPPAATPTFSPAAGTYSSPQSVTIADTSPWYTVYYTLDGSQPTTNSSMYLQTIAVSGTQTVRAIATSAGYTPSAIATATYTITSPTHPAPAISSLSPALASAGGPCFPITVNGSGFPVNAVVYWGSTALTTQSESPTRLVAQVPASGIATAGISEITVRTPAPGSGISNGLQFEIDSQVAGSTPAPVFTPNTAVIAPGSTASYAVALPATATNVSATCLNLPSGAACSYSAASRAVTISSQSNTPAGTYQVTVVFNETEAGAAAGSMLLPILLLPFTRLRKRTSAAPRWSAGVIVGMLLLLSGAWITACGGSSAGQPASPPSPPVASHQVTSSSTVSLTIQ